jgi:hypothetical protein
MKMRASEVTGDVAKPQQRQLGQGIARCHARRIDAFEVRRPTRRLGHRPPQEVGQQVELRELPLDRIARLELIEVAASRHDTSLLNSRRVNSPQVGPPTLSRPPVPAVYPATPCTRGHRAMHSAIAQPADHASHRLRRL